MNDNGMMQRPGRLFHLMLLVFGCVGILCATAEEITVVLKDPPTGGEAVFLLFDSATAFGDLRDPVKTVTLPLDGRDRYLITGVSPGTYALLVYHDVNGNGLVDRNFIGIPREPLGFSNGYRPKGPPSYRRAAFELQPDQTRDFTITLWRPLGPRGRLGVGVGIIGSSSPYRDYDGAIYQVIPALTYTGERLQIFGPMVQFGLVGSGKVRLAAIGAYRMGAYEEDDSDALRGMGDADETFMAGLSMQAEFANGLDLSLNYVHDVLGNIGGGEALVELGTSFQYKILRIAPQVGLKWMSADLVDNDFGVPSARALPDRPAYTPGALLNSEIGVSVFADITRDWLVFANVSLEFLGSEATDSPIVEKDRLTRMFAAFSYLF